MKKTFPCGHKGKGKYCHRCAAEKNASKKTQKNQQQDKQAKQAWLDTFADDPIDLQPLQLKSRILKARKIIRGIANGIPYTQFRGKRMNYDRHVITIPINRDFRLIYHETDNGLELIEVIDHEKYNVTKPGEKH